MDGFRIGGGNAEYMAVTVSGRSHPDATDFWDGNWLNARADLRAGGFTGRVDGYLRAEELEQFRGSMAALYESLSGRAVFETMEDWLALTLTGDGKGHIATAGRLVDVPGTGNELRFSLDLDQTYLPRIIGNLGSIVDAYPVRGQPEG